MPASKGESPVAEILQVRDAWLEAVKARDIDRLLSLLTEDIIMMHPGRPSISGQAANRADLVAAFEKFDVEQSVVSDEIVISGEWAFDRSRTTTRLTPVSGGSPATVYSKAITVLRRQPDGSWKIARVIGNLDHPTEKTA